MVIAEMRNCVVSPEMGKDVVFNGTFQVRAGERVAVVGPNGSGKTTLLMLLSGLNRPSSGQVQVFGSRPNIRSEAFRSRIGLLMQHPDDQLLAPTVFDDVSLTLRAQGWATTDIKIRTDEVLSQLGIEHLRERPPHHLSGGEKKMVALAGALVHKPELLLLDEPFAGLDGFAVVAMIKTLAEYNSRLQGSIVISSHDLEGLSEWADKAYVVSQGALSEPYGIERVLAERRALDLKSQGYPDIPAVYSRLLVESLRNKCYNAGEVMN